MLTSFRSFPARRCALLIVAAAMFAAPCFAQSGEVSSSSSGQTDGPPQGPPPDGAGPRHGGPDRRAEMLEHQLSLTSEQTTQVRALLEAEHAKMEALHANAAALSREEMHTQMMAVHQDSDTRLRALLTPDQATKYDAMQARMRQHRQEEQGPPPTPPSGSLQR